MPDTVRPYIDRVNYEGTEYDIYDTAHTTLTQAEVTTGTDQTPKFITAKVFSDVISGLGGGTVTDVKLGTTSGSASTVVTSGEAYILTKTAYNASSNKVVTETDIANFITGGANSASSVSITPSTTSVYSMSSDGTAPTLTFAKDTTDAKQLNISWSAGSMPSRSQVTGLWNGYTSATAGAQTFTGTNNIQSAGGNTF